MWNNSTVEEMHNSSQIEEMWNNSTVEEMHNSSQIGEMRNDSMVREMYGSSQIGEMWDNSMAKDFKNLPTIKIWVSEDGKFKLDFHAGIEKKGKEEKNSDHRNTF